MKKKIGITFLIVIVLIGIGGTKFILNTRKYNDYLIKANESMTKKEYEKALDYVNKASNYKRSDEIEKIKKEIEDDKKFDKQVADLEASKKETDKMVKALEKRNNSKPQLITDSNNLRIWKVYLLKGNNVFQINVDQGEEDNVIVHLNNKIIINEIGKGKFAGEVSVPEDGWYRLKIETKMGYSWKFE